MLPVASELRAKERIEHIERLKAKLDSNEPLLMGSFSTGVGILDRAGHEGLEQAGIRSRLAFTNEISPDYMQHGVQRNPVTRRAPLARDRCGFLYFRLMSSPYVPFQRHSTCDGPTLGPQL